MSMRLFLGGKKLQEKINKAIKEINSLSSLLGRNLNTARKEYDYLSKDTLMKFTHEELMEFTHEDLMELLEHAIQGIGKKYEIEKYQACLNYLTRIKEVLIEK